MLLILENDPIQLAVPVFKREASLVCCNKALQNYAWRWLLDSSLHEIVNKPKFIYRCKVM